MFTILDGSNRTDGTLELFQMFSKQPKDGLSQDFALYDHRESIYLLFQDPLTGLKGSARLNPMTCPNLIKTTLGDRVKAYEKSYIWECSALSFEGEAQESSSFYKAFQEVLETVRQRFHISLVLFMRSASEIHAMKTVGKVPFQTILPLDRQGHQCLALLQNAYHH